jgi:hypothetical protein
LTSDLIILAAKKNTAKTIKANTMFGSKTISPLIIPWIFAHAADTDAWRFMTLPRKH